jgi:hypothetical protein
MARHQPQETWIHDLAAHHLTKRGALEIVAETAEAMVKLRDEHRAAQQSADRLRREIDDRLAVLARAREWQEHGEHLIDPDLQRLRQMAKRAEDRARRCDVNVPTDEISDLSAYDLAVLEVMYRLRASAEMAGRYMIAARDRRDRDELNVDATLAAPNRDLPTGPRGAAARWYKLRRERPTEPT